MCHSTLNAVPSAMNVNMLRKQLQWRNYIFACTKVVLPSLNSNLSLPLMAEAHCWFDSVSKMFKVDICFRYLIYQFMQLAELSGLFTFQWHYNQLRKP